MKKLLFFIVCLLFLILPLNVNAKELNMYLFYGQECPHCEAEIEYLDGYLKNKSNIKLYKYEVWHNTDNAGKMQLVADSLNTTADSVPFLVIGNKTLHGYNKDYTNNKINDYIDCYRSIDYRDIAGEVLGVVPVDQSKKIITSCSKKNENVGVKKVNNNTIDKDFSIPILGKITARSVSLPLLAVVMGFVDGFNPCATWILILLITMLIGMKDRKKMWILGITFLLTSALVYTLFMVSWLNLALFVNKIVLIRLFIALVALIFGGYNIYNYIKHKNSDEGCEIVDAPYRKKIINKIKDITTNKIFLFSLLGIIVLAASVNIIELMCSLGLPVIFTQVLSLNDLSTFKYAVLIFIYILFFLIDDLVIFFVAMKTLKIAALSNKYTKYSHLIGGIIMLILGLLMIIKPEWLMFNF